MVGGLEIIDKLAAADPALAAEAARLFTREVRTAPTLVKYAQPNDTKPRPTPN